MSGGASAFDWKPKTWIAITLSIVSTPLALLYLQRVRWAAMFFLWMVTLGLLGFVLPSIFGSSHLSLIVQLLTLLAGVVVCYRIVAQWSAQGRRRWYSRWPALLGLPAAVLLVIVGCTTFLFEPFHVPSTSMAPMVGAGANLIVQKWGYGHYSNMGIKMSSRPVSAALHRGDIIVFDYPVDARQTYIKRLVGLPGDQVVYRDKHLYVNGIDARGRLLEEYLEELDNGSSHYLTRFVERLGETEYEVLNDPNRDRYPDQREFPLRDSCQFSETAVSCRVPANHYFVLGDNRDNSADSRDWGYVRSDQIVGKVVKIFR